jgi:hypothetical protein
MTPNRAVDPVLFTTPAGGETTARACWNRRSKRTGARAAAAVALALAACGPPQGPRPEVVAEVIRGSGDRVGVPVALDMQAMAQAASLRDALEALRRKGFNDADPAPCKPLLPDAPRPAAVEHTDVEAGAGAELVRRILICAAQTEEPKAVRAVGVIAARQKQADAQKGGKP